MFRFVLDVSTQMNYIVEIMYICYVALDLNFFAAYGFPPSLESSSATIPSFLEITMGQNEQTVHFELKKRKTKRRHVFYIKKCFFWKFVVNKC